MMDLQVTDKSLLIIEDDPLFTEEVKHHFSAKGNSVYIAHTLKEAKALLGYVRFDAIVLDLVLPDGDGLALLEQTSLPPVVILSVLGNDECIMTGLNTGAADYIVKPCSLSLLETRLALRLLPEQQAVIQKPGLLIDIAHRVAKYNGLPLHLTSSEFDILHFLVAHADVYYTADALYQNIWGAPSLHTTTVRYHISNLRKKLQAAAGRDLIITQFGKGYAFVSEP